MHFCAIWITLSNYFEDSDLEAIGLCSCLLGHSLHPSGPQPTVLTYDYSMPWPTTKVENTGDTLPV